MKKNEATVTSTKQPLPQGMFLHLKAIGLLLLLGVFSFKPVAATTLSMNSPKTDSPVLENNTSVLVNNTQQKQKITGSVKDEFSNEGLVGATIAVKGANKGTITDSQGNFSLEISKEDAVLVISFIGYTSQTIGINGKSVFNIKLKPDVQSLDELVVTGVFDKRKKIEASVAISSIPTKLIETQVPNSAADLLKNIPGVYVNSSLGEVRNTVYSRGVSVGSNDGASGYYYVSMQEDGLPVSNVSWTNFGPDYFLRADATIGKMEAVRGGTASIMGANAPGGIFNYISKEGGDKTEGVIRTKYGLEGDGNNNLYRADFNLSGPLKKGWKYSIGGFYRYDEGARYPGYPLNKGGQIKANLIKKYKTGSVKVYGKILDDHNGWYEFTPTVGFSDPKPAPGFSSHSSTLSSPVKVSFPINDTGRTGTFDSKSLTHSKDYAVGANWEQSFGKGWKMVDAMKYSKKSATWNSNALVFPMKMDDLMTYAIVGLLGKPGTYSFVGTKSNQELLNVTSWSGYDFNINKSSLPGSEVSKNSLFFEPFLYRENKVDEYMNQLTINKTMENMSFAFGGFYGHSKIDVTEGAGGAGFGTIQDKPEIVKYTLTDLTGNKTSLTNDQGIAGIGGSFSLYNVTQNHLALFFGHNWQVTKDFNLDWGIRFENLHFKGQNKPGVTSPSTTGGVDKNPATAYDNNMGTTPIAYNYDKSVSSFSYSAGANYKFNEGLALYGRYSVGQKSPDLSMFMGVDTQFENDHLNPEPQKVEQIEFGVKVVEDKLNLFITPFYSTLSNVAMTQVFTNPDQTYYSPPVNYNKLRTMGIEFESNYKIGKHLDIRGVATFQKSKAIKYDIWLANGTGPSDDAIASYSGNEIDNVARSMINITPTYTINKLSAHLTWAYLGKRQANVANAFLLPTFSQFDFGAEYNVSKKLQLSLNVNNLFNKYGVMGWTRPGSFLEAIDRQGFTKQMYEDAVKNNTLYSTIAIPPRSYFITLSYKF